ncbi:MAG: hypothetical protein CME71_12775 [Halobacteriovorax sp.]|nr:hypothetical protein [Halobacteriovorax sp.]
MNQTKLAQEVSQIVVEVAKSRGDLWWAFSFSSKNRFYAPLFQIFKPARLKLSWFETLVSALKFIFAFTVKVLLTRLNNGSKFRKIKLHKNVVVIKTFSFEKSNYEDFVDPFFPGLSLWLESKGKEVLTFYEPTGSLSSVCRKNKNQQMIGFYDVAQFYDLLLVLTDVMKSFAFSFFDSLDIKSSNVDKASLNKLVMYEHFSPATLQARLNYYIYKRLINKTRIERFIYTYENNSWERMALLAIKEKPEIKTIGYQHNVLPQASINMYLSPQESQVSPCPDNVLTTGERTRDILLSKSALSKESILVACALRYDYLFKMKAFPRNKNKVALLALEGVWQVLPILEKLNDISTSLGDWKIIIRCHPVLPIEKMSEQLSFNYKETEQFLVSKDVSLIEDIERSSSVIYWGSTVGLESVKLGRPVVNIAYGELNFDPLYELSQFKSSWGFDNFLRDVLESIISIDDEEYFKQLRVANGYIDTYFKEVNEDNLEVFLQP